MWIFFWTFLATIATPILKVILRALGIGGITYIGFTLLLDTVKTQFEGLFAGVPADIVQVITLLGFFEVVSLFFSALTVKLILGGVQNNRVSVWAKPNPQAGTVFGA